jgi:hypothetical protein
MCVALTYMSMLESLFIISLVEKVLDVASTLKKLQDSCNPGFNVKSPVYCTDEIKS